MIRVSQQLLRRRRTATTYANLTLSHSPAGYWRLGEAVGAGSVIDSSGNARHGTPTALTFGAAGAIAGDSDTAATFNGSTSVVTLPAALTDLTGNWTVIVWFKRATSSRGTNDSLWSRWTNSASQRQLYIYLNPSGAGAGNNKIQVDVPWKSAVMTGTTAITDTNWHMAAVTRSANSWVLYLDGVSNQTATNSTVQEAGAVPTIGRSTVLGESFSGSIDEVTVIPTALSGPQILAIYNKGIGA